MGKKKKKLRGVRIGKGEMEVLRLVQGRHPVTVREVADELAATRGVGRTTVLNVMSRLVKKGFLARKMVEGVFVYVPRESPGKQLRDLIGDFVRGTLGGKLMPLVAYLADDADLTEEEVAELKKVVEGRKE